MTAEFLQDAIVADLKILFQHDTMENSLGVTRTVNVFKNDTPIRQGDDDGEDREAPPEPYVVVKTLGGDIQDESGPHVIKIVMVACVCDPDPERQGNRDAMHLVNEIYRHIAAKGIVGKKFSLQYPIHWAVPDDDTHPYYYAAVSMNFETRAVIKEVPEL